MTLCGNSGTSGVPPGYVFGDGIWDVYVDAVHGSDTGFGATTDPVQDIITAINILGTGSTSVGGGIRLAGSPSMLIDRQPDVLAQAGPVQVYGTGGARVQLPHGTQMYGGGWTTQGTGRASSWIMDTVPADALVRMLDESRLENVALTNRAADGFAIDVLNPACVIGRTLVQGSAGVCGIRLRTISIDDTVIQATRVIANNGVGVWMVGSAGTADPPQAFECRSVKSHGNQHQQWLYDSQDSAAGTNVGGKVALFYDCQAQAPLAFASITDPLWEIRGGANQDHVGTYFETGAKMSNYALRIDAGCTNPAASIALPSYVALAYGGRPSLRVRFLHPRFHTNFNAPYFPVFIDNAVDCDLIEPEFNTGSFTPSATAPLVMLGPGTRNCTVDIGYQATLAPMTYRQQVVDQGIGNTVRVWDYTYNRKVEIGAGGTGYSP